MPMESAVGKNAPPSRSDSGSSTSSSRWNHAAIPVNSIRKASFEPHLFEGQESLARKIDHTLLKPDATPEQIRKVCEEARKYQFATVCVNSSYVKTVADLLKGSATVPIAVVGFPLGASSTASKVFETNEAIKNGAGEIDMVINIGALKAKDYAHVLDDISAVVDAAAPVPVKVILETAELTQEEKVIGCALTKAADAAFVKTSTGFASGGATVEDIELMRRIVGDEMGVKASGGIRTQEDAKKMIQAGASRIGASASVAIVTGTSEKKDSKNKSYKSSLY
ncbi:MAG: deoxyribose-phosphate aldolase [Bdellovibrionaceae bacterium]|nr:deoxyribose-phosphate aldolase [Pseudobdellovibrionaceae bacterium]